MITEICGDQTGKISIVGKKPLQNNKIKYDVQFLVRKLGLILINKQSEILKKLGLILKW